MFLRTHVCVHVRVHTATPREKFFFHPRTASSCSEGKGKCSVNAIYPLRKTCEYIADFFLLAFIYLFIYLYTKKKNPRKIPSLS